MACVKIVEICTTYFQTFCTQWEDMMGPLDIVWVQLNVTILKQTRGSLCRKCHAEEAALVRIMKMLTLLFLVQWNCYYMTMFVREDHSQRTAYWQSNVVLTLYLSSCQTEVSDICWVYMVEVKCVIFFNCRSRSFRRCVVCGRRTWWSFGEKERWNVFTGHELMGPSSWHASVQEKCWYEVASATSLC